MKQSSFATKEFVLKPKRTRKEKFLQEMEEVVPWARLEALIEPHYPKAGKGRKPYGLSTMLCAFTSCSNGLVIVMLGGRGTA